MPQLTKTISRLEKNNDIGYNSIVHNSEFQLILRLTNLAITVFAQSIMRTDIRKIV